MALQCEGVTEAVWPRVRPEGQADQTGRGCRWGCVLEEWETSEGVSGYQARCACVKQSALHSGKTSLATEGRVALVKDARRTPWRGQKMPARGGAARAQVVEDALPQVAWYSWSV